MCIPLATLVIITFFPLNLAISTFLSAATIIHVAFSISSLVNIFLAPEEPLVSTFIDTPFFSPAFAKLSAAIKVWAIPVGQAVTASTVGYLESITTSSTTSLDSSGNFSLSFLSIKAINSSTEVAFIKLFLNSSSISIVDNLDNTSKWVSLAPSGAAIIKNKWDKLPSKDS